MTKKRNTKEERLSDTVDDSFSEVTPKYISLYHNHSGKNHLLNTYVMYQFTKRCGKV